MYFIIVVVTSELCKFELGRCSPFSGLGELHLGCPLKAFAKQKSEKIRAVGGQIAQHVAMKEHSSLGVCSNVCAQLGMEGGRVCRMPFWLKSKRHTASFPQSYS